LKGTTETDPERAFLIRVPQPLSIHVEALVNDDVVPAQTKCTSTQLHTSRQLQTAREPMALSRGHPPAAFDEMHDTSDSTC
jgi:hypothetical protein